jgi:K+-sensing histidine kinase KdpD
LDKNPEEIFGKASAQIIHDIRNYLNTVIGFSSLIQNNKNIGNEEQLYINKISDAGYLIEKLLYEINAYTNEDFDIEPEEISFNQIINKFFENNKNKISEKNILVFINSMDEIKLSSSSVIIEKILDALLEFSLKGLRGGNIEKNIYIYILKKNKNAALYYSDSSLPVLIKNEYFNTEEILTSRRGLSLFFLEKYVSSLNGTVQYFHGKGWEKEISDLNNKASTHGFKIIL